MKISVTCQLIRCPHFDLGAACKLEFGDGIGGTETREPNMGREQCVHHCMEKRKTHPTINGATVGFGRCYCEYNMKSRNHNYAWRNCKFEPSKYDMQHILMLLYTLLALVMPALI